MRSMTGFATAEGATGDGRWRWELRSVNGRGLELRFRTPTGFENVESKWRNRVGTVFSRGTVTATLVLDEARTTRAARLDEAALDAAIAALKAAQARAEQAGLSLAPLTAAALLEIRGVYEPEAEGGASASPAAARREAVLAPVDQGFETALQALLDARSEEGARMGAVLAARLDEISALTVRAREAVTARGATAADQLREKVQALIGVGAPVDEARLAQELATLAVKADVSEELDRLEAHIAAGRDLLAGKPPVGRKLDFLTQEFNREANTLCAKAQDAALTEIGLALKVVIDQLREQSANVE